jgi:energy-coupling factor transporter ATP-binding protein EcfA2
VNLKIRIQNIASFQDSEQFEIRPGINAFIGINNSGKTALLWSLGMLGCVMRDEKSAWSQALIRKMNGYQRGTTNPAVAVEYTLPRDIRDQVVGELCQLGGKTALPRYEATQETFTFNIRFNQSNHAVFVNPVSLRYKKDDGGYVDTDILKLVMGTNEYTVEPLFGGQFPNPWSPSKFVAQRMGEENGGEFFRFGETDKGIAKCWPSILNSVYVLGANRNQTERYQTRTGTIDLKPDAENLVQVLRTANQTTRDFRGSRQQFERVEASLRSVFPEIKQLRVEVIPDQSQMEDQSEIVLDMANGQTVPLGLSGTGVFQITTLLAAALLKPNPSLFLIDEPHAYLHPAAEKALVRILEDLAKERGHIFCLATHSPILSSQCRQNCFAVVNRGDNSKVIELQDTSQLLQVLGVTNADFFTYDKVLFVEGESDAAVFNLLLNFLDKSGMSERTKIVDLSGDGKLRKVRNASHLKMLLIHASASKLRIPVGFLLDSGGRTEQEKTDLGKVLQKPPEAILKLLLKPELEDYLLDPISIGALLRRERKLLNLEEQADLEDIVKKVIEKGSPKGSLTLQTCFQEAIEGRDYRKKEDSLAIAAEILTTNPEFLTPLFGELKAAIERIGTAAASA